MLRKCAGWFETGGCVLRYVHKCVCGSVCNVGGMVWWHAEFVIALPHVRDWPRDSAVYLRSTMFVVCGRDGGRGTALND